MKVNLDTFDHSILAFLQQDATISMDKLVDVVHLSRNACWRRIKAMEAAGVIRGRVTLVDPVAIGCPLLVFVMIRTHSHDPKWLKDFEQAVASIPDIIGAHRMSGDLDYVLRVRVADVAGYDAFYQRLISQVPIADISASFVMDDLKDTTALPL